MPSDELQEGAQQIFPGVAFHWTIKNYEMTYGGLHQTKAGAEESKKTLVEKEIRDLGPVGRIILLPGPTMDRIQGWKNAPVIQLEKGEVFHPWGTGLKYAHGVDDGTHGSMGPVNSPENFGPARLLKPHLGI